jgi:hypothetical protein
MPAALTAQVLSGLSATLTQSGYFRVARHSTRIWGSAAWIRDFHEETSSPEDICATVEQKYDFPRSVWHQTEFREA